MMTNSNPLKPSDSPTGENQPQEVTPLRCLLGALISAPFAIALYFLTSAIAQNFATKPVTSSNQFVIQIAIAVRTLVVGMATLGTGIFTVVTVGLVLLAVQLTIQNWKQSLSSPPSNK
jgi:hypothetical protein